MKDLSPNLYEQCRVIFLKCSEFDNDESLRAIFSVSQLRGYTDKIFEANSRERRVDNCLHLLHVRSFKGEPMLALLLEMLCSRYPEEDDLHIELHKVAQKVRLELQNDSNLRTIFEIQDTAGKGSNQKVLLPASPSEEVDVGIVIALKEEFAELFSQFENSYISVYDEKAHAHYYLFQLPERGHSKPYRCVATFVGSMGAVKTGLATEKLINRWYPRILVIMGIAASLDADVKLGDVVVANQVDMYLENAKAVPTMGDSGYTFQPSSEVYRSDYDISHSMHHMEFKYREVFQNWQHQGATELQCLSLNKKIAALVSAGNVRNHPLVHFGHIASGPIVGGAGVFKNWLKQVDRKYLALEMETGGFMEAVYERLHSKTLIIRAISDYGDEHKKKLDRAGQGAFRRYALHNAIRLLWSFFETDILFHP